ncbi:tagatose-bisphosphate aldolase catalytic subunit [Lachnotalea glycerini]|uniref:Class II fructose-1,6-bisphosphate aldolase n=1 Tax=Lachnotalea glycerini TaxID=1763509 RepID=A0A255I4V6_9FIRM|nr:class II fructose-1,6-bisphosphate aldolase [Lachnotalea glycerini]PXV86631.1 tagatose-bisphosphate aldolase catalytic subunit [Lachnotalea glycerini]RDY32139.1 class II fructose-1,6-bisphosphate aldolase [Lachnotalea glycerini]
MPLVSTKEMLLKASKGNYAVAAFNVENMEMVQAVIEAAEELNAPVILQTTPSTVKYGGITMYRSMVNAIAQVARVPVAMHLDHGDSPQLCKEAIEGKYTSVMIDGSKLSFEENIQVSKLVVEMAKDLSISIEAELGTVGGKEDGHIVTEKEALYTNPAQAREFVEKTNVNSLAIAIGTAHGFYKGEPKIDFERLSEIKEIVEIPLVLHGASGLPDTTVIKAIELGICKVNFATELRAAYTKGVRKILDSDVDVFDPKKYGTAGRTEVKELVKHKITICKSVGKA